MCQAFVEVPMHAPASHCANQDIHAHAAADALELDRLRALDERERGQMLAAACVAAAEIERSRRAAGLPPSQPAPWPASTWEFLRKHASNVRG
jgi:hypothetical protein